MWYWFYEIASVTLVIGLVALILWWAWRQETASRFANTLDRRFAPHKTQPKEREEPKPLKAYLDWVNWRKELEQRVTALEEGQEDLERGAHSLILTHIKAWHSPSPPPDLTPGPTASATTPTSLKDVKVHMEKTQAPTT